MNEKETSKDIIADMRTKAECAKPYDDGIVMMLTDYADRLEAAHKRDVDALKQRLAELNAEVAAKDEVIKRLNDAISEEQRRKMAAPEKSSAVGDAAKLREAMMQMLLILYDAGNKFSYSIACGMCKAYARKALAEPPRNCDRFGGDIDRLREACARERGLNPEEDFPDVFPDWLLAPATKKEGGAR